MVGTRRGDTETPIDAQPESKLRAVNTKKSTGSRTGASRRFAGSAGRNQRSSYHFEVRASLLNQKSEAQACAIERHLTVIVLW